MSRKQTLWLASGVWGAGFMVCGAFAFAMNQPLVMHYDETAPRTVERIAAVESVVRAPTEVSTPLTFPALEINVPREQLAPRAPVVVTPPPARDITQMNCADWRPLEQGGNAVRECQ